MHGLMMDYPLTVTTILDRIEKLYANQEIVTKQLSGTHRYTYRDFHERTCRLAQVLRRLGLQPGERVATLGWNTYSHLELYYAVPCSGAVLHTLNLRLPPQQIGYIANHAQDSILFVDQALTPLLAQFIDTVPSVRHIVAMNEDKNRSSALPVLHYEDLLADVDPHYDWPDLDENTAASLCYTSGTTGHPKGCLYSHRALFLHSMAENLAAVFGTTELDTIFPIVPMFHANAWGVPYSAMMVGAKQVLPGPNLQPDVTAQTIQDERVTIVAGVPTIFLGLYSSLERGKYDVSSVRLGVCGGAAAPRAMIEGFKKKYGIPICHAWGMTELSPLGTLSRLRSHMKDLPEERQLDVLALQGTPPPGVEIRGIDAEGNEIPWDGRTLGELQVRGPWVIKSYYEDPRTEDSFMDGWFRTGDVVTINPDGCIHVVDRTKDLIKSGGEWISSVDLESAIMGHPQILEAAVIAVPHETWQERPLACVVPRPEFRETLKSEDIVQFLESRVPHWWLPEEIVFLEAVPKTSVGKFDKKALRQQFLTRGQTVR